LTDLASSALDGTHNLNGIEDVAKAKFKEAG
jgi:hypothetical protein